MQLTLILISLRVKPMEKLKEMGLEVELSVCNVEKLNLMALRMAFVMIVLAEIIWKNYLTINRIKEELLKIGRFNKMKGYLINLMKAICLILRHLNLATNNLDIESNRKN